MKLLYKYLVFLVVFFFSTLGSSSVFAAAPTFTVAFSPTTLGPSSTSTMTYTIDNSAETTGVTGLTFSTLYLRVYSSVTQVTHQAHVLMALTQQLQVVIVLHLAIIG